MLNLVVSVLATWRLARLFFWERGPYAVFQRIRDHYGVVEYQKADGSYERDMDKTPTEIGKGLCCFWCTSVWAGIAITILQRRFSLTRALALSAGALFVGFLQDRLEKRS